MNIFCVAGGSYKAFYLNCFLHIKKCDLLIINFGVLYDLYKLQNIEKSVVGNELLSLSKALNCVVVAGLNINNKEIIAICKSGSIEFFSAKNGGKFIAKNMRFIATNKFCKHNFYNKIVLSRYKIHVNTIHCSKHKNYLFFHGSGVDFIKNKKLQRKFNKYSKFILK